MQLSNSGLAWLRCFEATSRHLSFTKAATELCVTQGAVSQQVKQLEAWLQRPLFVRAPRALVLTQEGQRLASVTRDSLRAIEGVLAQLRPTHGPLTLSCAPSFAMSWLTPRLGDFFRNHPQIGLRIIGEFHALDQERMARDEVAAAVRYDLGHYEDLLPVEILDEWLLPVASPEFMAAHHQLRSPADLHPAMLLHDSSAWAGAGPFDEWEFWLDDAGVRLPDLRQGRHYNFAQLAQGAALTGQGVAMARAALVLDELVSGRLVAPFGRPVRSRAAYHFVSMAPRGADVETVLSWLQTQAAQFRALRDGVLQKLGQ